jgi:hypothetical protein
MAVEGCVNDLRDPLHDVLLDFLRQLGRAARPRLEATLEDIADLLRPHPPMSLRTMDGEILTGVVVVDRGRVIAFLGTRSAPPPLTQFRSAPPFEHDDDYWDPPHGPYGR